PVVIRAKNRGRARIVGSGGFRVRKTGHVAIEGFVFEHGDETSALAIQDAHHVRFTRNVVRLRERPETEYEQHQLTWIALAGGQTHHNRIDHNLIEEKRNSGPMIATSGTPGNVADMVAV